MSGKVCGQSVDRAGRSFAKWLAVDFWGHDRQTTIGTWRPILDLLEGDLGSRRHGLLTRSQIPNLLVHGLVVYSLVQLGLRLRLIRQENELIAAVVLVALTQASEAVFLFVGLADLLVALFSIWGALLFLAPQVSKAKSCALLFVVGGLAMLSKESAPLTLFALAFAALFIAQESPPRGQLFAMGGALSLGVAGGIALRWQFFGGLSLPTPDPLNNPLVALDGLERILGSFDVLARNLGQFFWPHPLRHDYSAPTSVFSIGAAACGLSVTAIALVVLFSRTSRALRFATALWLPLALAASNVLLLLPTVRAERLLYLANLGLGLGLVSWALAAPKSKATQRWRPLALLAFASIQADFWSLSVATTSTICLFRSGHQNQGSAKSMSIIQSCCRGDDRGVSTGKESDDQRMGDGPHYLGMPRSGSTYQALVFRRFA